HVCVKHRVLVLEQALVRWQQRHLAKPRTQFARAAGHEALGHLHAVHHSRDVLARLEPARGARAHHDDHFVVLEHGAHALAVARLNDQARRVVGQATLVQLAGRRDLEELWRRHGNEQAVVLVQWQRHGQAAFRWCLLLRGFVRVEVVETHGLAHELARRDDLLAVRRRERRLVERGAKVVDGAFDRGAELLVQRAVAWAFGLDVVRGRWQLETGVRADGIALGVVIEALGRDERRVVTWVGDARQRALGGLGQELLTQRLVVGHVVERDDAVGLECPEDVAGLLGAVQGVVVERRDRVRGQVVVRRVGKGAGAGQAKQHGRDAHHVDVEVLGLPPSEKICKCTRIDPCRRWSFCSPVQSIINGMRGPAVFMAGRCGPSITGSLLPSVSTAPQKRWCLGFAAPGAAGLMIRHNS
ncbi:TPA: hypothetical protein N0F65_005685, partial [Lagenidium giganteum]